MHTLTSLATVAILILTSPFVSAQISPDSSGTSYSRQTRSMPVRAEMLTPTGDFQRFVDFLKQYPVVFAMDTVNAVIVSKDELIHIRGIKESKQVLRLIVMEVCPIGNRDSCMIYLIDSQTITVASSDGSSDPITIENLSDLYQHSLTIIDLPK